MAHDVFISYSSTDQNAALAVLHGLETAGIRCWMAPRDIRPGSVWAQAIMDGIAGCRVMVVVFSANANKSSHVLNEVDAAVRKGAIVIPFRIENIMPDGAMEYHLRSRHWLDALTPDLEAHSAALAEQVQGVLDGGAPLQTLTPPPREMPRDLPKRAKPTPPKKSIDKRKLVKPVVGGVLVLVALCWWFFIRETPVSGVEFVVRETSSSGGNEMSFTMKSRPLRFFEAGPQIPPMPERKYEKVFAAGATRYLYPEVGMTYDKPGKALRVPISCAVMKAGGQVVTNLSIMASIQANWDTSSHTQGWGNAAGGTWESGRYRFDCSYGGKLIARDWIEVVGGGAVTQNPPAPPNPPPPVTRQTPPPVNPPPPAETGDAGALASIRGRISSVKLFSSGARIPPAPSRVDTRRFGSAVTQFIGVEVSLAHQAPGRVVNTQVICRFLYGRERETEIGRITLNYQIQPDWTGTVNAANWGRESPGYWAPGQYFLACLDDTGQMLTQLGFTVQ